MFARPAPRKMIWVMIVAVVAGAGVLGCRAGAGKPAPAEELALTDSDAGKTFYLGDHKSVTITVRSNGSIGYGWSFEKITGDAIVLDGEESKDNGPPAPGDSESTIYRFRVVKAGEASIVMDYTHRDSSKFTTETRTFTIVVDQAP